MTSSLNDSTILRETTFSKPDDKGRAQLQFKLPSGRMVTSSDWLVPSEVKGKVLIAWANAIRAEDAFDLQEREERERLARVEKQTRELSSAARSAEGAPASNGTSPGPSGSSHSPAETFKSSSTSSLPDDPRELVRAKLVILTGSLAELVAQRGKLLTQIQEVEANISRWTSIAQSLGVQESPPVESTSDSSSTPQLSLPFEQSNSNNRLTHDVRRTPRSLRRERRRAQTQQTWIGENT